MHSHAGAWERVKFSEKMNAEFTSENAKYDVITNYSKWQEVVS
jgi:hypothetical protein